MQRTDSLEVRVGCIKRTASKHVYYLGWNISPAQVGCMRQALGPGALGRPGRSGWRGRWEGGSGWGTHVNPRPFHFSVWQNSLQKKKKKKELTHWKRSWCWERLRAGGEGDDRGWDGWMASQTQWARVWVSFRSWWWIRRPSVLQSMGLQRVRHDWAIELNWTESSQTLLVHGIS